MRKIHIHTLTGLLSLVLTIMPCTAVKAQADPTVPPTLIISEVQTTGLSASGTEDGTQEFVEVYNPSSLPLDSALGWRVEYLSATNSGSGAPTRVLAQLDISVGPKSYLLFSYENYLPGADKYFGAGNTSSSGWMAKSGGHVRIVDAAGRTIDAVDWGSAVPLTGNPPISWWHASSIPAGNSIQGLLPGAAGYVSGLEFTAPSEPNPYGGNRPLPTDPALPPESESPGDEPETENPPDIPMPQCDRITLSELLPNPAGPDAGHEFIEIYNPTEALVKLKGCSLRVGSGPAYDLPDEVLETHAYRAFYDSETGITLPNATAQAVLLTTTAGQQSVLYPDGLGDNQSWSFIDGSWVASDLPTPGSSNARPAPSQGSGVVVRDTKRAVSTSNAQAVCPPGKERNPATNRCRSVVAATSASLIPCKSGQERSPETNRCRSVLAATTEPKPCPQGQERNSGTNRCRKKVGLAGANLAQVQDVKTVSAGAAVRWWIAGLVAAGAGSYALYEWRRDVVAMLYKLRPARGGKK